MILLMMCNFGPNFMFVPLAKLELFKKHACKEILLYTAGQDLNDERRELCGRKKNEKSKFGTYFYNQ